MIKVYVAGNYSADNVIDVLKNIGKGEKTCSELFYDGFAPFCCWHDASYAKEACYAEIDKDRFYKASITWLKVSDCMYVISGKGKGGGVDAEINIAEDLHIPIFYNYTDLYKWSLKQYALLEGI